MKNTALSKMVRGKPLKGEGATIHINSRMTKIFKYGFSKRVYFEVIDDMLSTLSTYTASGNEWIVQKKQQHVEFANIYPIRGFSYLTVETELKLPNLFF